MKFSTRNILILSIISLGLINSALSADCPKDEKLIFCYYASWAVYRPTFGSFNASNVDTSLCTHIMYSFAGLGIDGVTISLDAYNDLPESGGLQQFYHFRMLKEENPCIKIMLSIGGWSEGSEKYSVMSETEEARVKFADHLLRFLIYYGFDGADLDWEYPAQRGGISEDKQNFVLLLTEMKRRLNHRGKLLTIAVGASTYLTAESYDVKGISDAVDYVLLMTYDYQLSDTTSYLAPLRRVDGDPNAEGVSDGVKIWLDSGCPSSKLVLGIQTSGRTYTLASPNSDPKLNGVGMAASGPGTIGLYTRSAGFLAYYEICEIIVGESYYISSNDPVYASSYATKGNQWIAYEDASSVKTKASFAVEQKMAGILVWTIDTDDFHSICGAKSYGLLRAMNEGLGRTPIKYKK